MNRIKNILALALLTLSMAVVGQDALSLSDAITLGLEKNYDLKVMRNNEEVASINNTWGNTSLMPTVDFSLTGRENLNFNADENYRDQTITPLLSLNWVVFNGMSASINKARYEELEEQSQGNTVILVENTIQDIILAYNNCLLQKQLTEVYEELMTLSEDRYTRMQDSKDLGVSTTYQTLQAKTSWLEDQSIYLQQKVDYDNAVRTLNFTMGADNNALWSFNSELSIETADYNIDDLSSKLTSNNSTLKNQYLYQSLLAKQTQLSKSEYMPTVSMNVGLNNSDYSVHYSGATATTSSNSSNAYVGLTLSWSVFNGGTRKRSVAIAQINEESESVKTDQMEQSLNNQLLQLYSNYNVQKAIYELANEQEAAAKLNLELSLDKFKNGSINSFNYRDVQIAYMNAALAQVRAMFNLVESNTNLVRITGGIIDEYDN